MGELNRRTFVRSAGAGVVGVGVASLLPASLTGSASEASAAGAEPTHNSVVAYVRDVRAGTISVMAGEREVVITDKALARSLATAAG